MILQNETIVLRDEKAIDNFGNLKDEVIWNQFRAGSQEAFDFIYTRHFNALYTFCTQFSKCNGLIQDCIQDLFITIHKNRKNLGPTRSIRAYLYLSAKRKLVRYLKKEKRYTLVGDRSYEFNTKGENEMPFEFNLVAEQVNHHKALLLKKSFEKLPKNQKKALYLFYYEDYSYREIAEFMGMKNIKSARNLMYKALNNLKESF